MAIGFALYAGGCSSTYGSDDLSEGVPIRLDESETILESASLVAFWDLPDSLQLSVELSNGPASYSDISDEWDTVIVYRAGPFCGVPPGLEASREGTTVTISVMIRVEGDCEALEYEEAVGLTFIEEPDAVTVVVMRDE